MRKSEEKTDTLVEAYEDTDGIMGEKGAKYSEDDLNFKYELTIGALFATFLCKYGYVTKSKMFDKSMDEYENEVKDFMNMLIKNGYVTYKDD